MKLKNTVLIVTAFACPDDDLRQECINLCGEEYSHCGVNCNGEFTCFENGSNF
ncbi:unnamed protein product [Oikopleura dioica]|uniref:Uncharacterized protein n=1 Tax=Oikopleura dioica TaxID=34765 RepID=E4XQR9_OIKDI|nr:unnamed protein product [Oikopleura dioica]